jgi:CheY-like chemotaxis protein
MHGGTVAAASDGEGAGATFRVKLPMMIVHAERFETPREHPRTDRSSSLTALGDLNGIHVLAVDDEPDSLAMLRVVLETAGAEVTTVDDPLVAIERIEAAQPHVLVLDLGMPEMDGYELISRVRASSNPSVRNVPAAALTAFARSEDRTRVLRSGFEMHLAKPVDPGELVASVATLMRRGSRQA